LEREWEGKRGVTKVDNEKREKGEGESGRWEKEGWRVEGGETGRRREKNKEEV